MNMNKALQNLYHAVSGSTTTKVNISKLLVDIHYAITGVESSVKNNWSRIIDSMATNWPEGGGGGGGDYTTAEVTVISTSETPCTCAVPYIYDDTGYEGLYLMDTITDDTVEVTVPLYKGMCQAIFTLGGLSIAVTGDIAEDHGYCTITGNGTITITE